MATTPVPHEIAGVSSSDEERRSYAQHDLTEAAGSAGIELQRCGAIHRGVVETVYPSKVFWIDALNLGRRAMSL
jgi:hypothetical protein